MAELLLTVDLGNSRCKACCWPDAGGRDVGAPERSETFEPVRSETFEPVRSETFQVGAATAGELLAWLRAGPLPRASALSSVGPAAVERQLGEVLGALAPLSAPPPTGLRLDIRSPHTVGLDRLFAARGALELTGVPTLVVDAGTALTVDAVRPERPCAPRTGAGLFLGGAIAPGPALLARALAQGGARLPDFEPRPGVPALGKETREALRAGVAVGFEGAALRLVEQVAAEAGLAGACIVATGGALGFLEGALAEWGERVRVVPLLVHHGLRAALVESCPSSSS